MPPTLSDIETELRTGRGVAIIVEGETAQDDPYFFRKWFDDRADQIAFFPQDGWLQVQTAVSHLRQSSHVPVFGILDRDFCHDHELDALFNNDGLIRTRCYTLENYLLSVPHWASVFKVLYRRAPQLASQWGTEAFVENQIAAAYKTCLPLSAHNYVVKQANGWLQAQPSNITKPLDFLENIKTLNAINVEQRLTDWGTKIGHPQNLGDLYQQRFEALNKMPVENYEHVVSGKYVLDALIRNSPDIPGQGKLKLDVYIDQYIGTDPPAPIDLKQIIDRILDFANSKTP